MRITGGTTINAMNVTALSQNSTMAVSGANNSTIPPSRGAVEFGAASAAVLASGAVALAALRAEPGWQ